MDEIREECGVFSIGLFTSGKRNGFLAHRVYSGLLALQHRGQESAGIAVNEERVIRCHKGMGTVQEVFDEDTLQHMDQCSIAVGHVRYSTSGVSEPQNAQPLLVKHVKGQLAVCHNGNLVNSDKLRRELELSGCIFHTTSDTEVISYIITRCRLKTESIEEAVSLAMDQLKGAYSLVLMSPAKLIACRDENGFRPLVMGRREDGAIVFASETCALDAVGASFERELQPGEIVIADGEGVRSIWTHCGRKPEKLCLFEYIYFSRTDSRLRGLSVQQYRRESGKCLAREFPAEADAVIGVPDSGLDAALGFSEESRIPFSFGLIRNRYVGRTFIAPEQETREQLVRMKLNPVLSAVKEKRVVLVDDSLVRGTTSAYIIHLLKAARAAEVHMRISSPPFLNPCYYGTDIDSRENLMACRHSVEEIRKIIGADSLAFLPLNTAKSLCGRGAHPDVCTACFDGDYPEL